MRTIVNSKGYSLTEMLVATAILGFVVALVLSGLLIIARDWKENEANPELGLLRSKIAQSIQTSQHCKAALTNPLQRINPTLGATTTGINIMNYDGTGPFLYGTPTTGQNRFGDHWSVTRVSILVRGNGYSNATRQRIVIANLVVNRQRTDVANSQILTDNFGLSLILNPTNQVVDCYRSDISDRGVMTIPSCATTEKLVFEPPATGMEPVWQCKLR